MAVMTACWWLGLGQWQQDGGEMDRIKMRDAGGGPGLWGGQAVPSSADKEAKMNSVGCLFLQEELLQDVLA